MKRKMVWFGIPWLAGLFLATACQTSVTVSLLLAAFLLLGAFRLYRRITTGQLLCVGLSAAAAVGAVLLYTTVVYQPLLRSAGTITTFSGRVFAAKVYDNDRASYQVKGTFADGRRAKILVYTDDVGARYGDVLDVAGGFSALENSYLWNRESYYRAKGIFLQANNDAFVFCTPTENGKLVRALQQYRDRISVRICTLAGTEAGGMVSAMLLGTKDTLADETNDLLTHHGIRHVVSVSGLHLVLILSIWGWFCRRFHMHRWAVFGTTTVWTVLYALMVGTPISILRAGFMYLLMQSAPLFFRRGDTCNSLCIAGVLMTIGNPYLIQDASFLLSFVGTFGIGVFAPWLTKRLRKKGLEWSVLRQLATVTSVSVCVFPVTLLYFREVSVASPIANLFLVPICSAMLALSLLIFLTSFGILLAGQAVYRASEQRCFLVTVLGQKQEEVVVVTYAGKTDVIDLTGDHRNPKYVEAYCAEQGITRLNTLCLTKYADQMRIAYPDALWEMPVAETAVPADCWIPADADFMGTKPLQTDKFIVEDTQYTLTESDGIVWITFGNLHFCVGTTIQELPDTADAVICTRWNGEPDAMPEETYAKEDAVQIRVYPDGSWNVNTLGKH